MVGGAQLEGNVMCDHRRHRRSARPSFAAAAGANDEQQRVKAGRSVGRSTGAIELAQSSLFLDHWNQASLRR